MSSGTPERAFISVHEAAVRLGVSDGAVRNWIRDGEIRAIRMGGSRKRAGRVLVYASSIPSAR